MIRAALLLLCALLLTACGPDSGTEPGTEPGEKSAPSADDTESDEPEVGTAPVTGSPMFRKDTQAITRDLDLLERQGRPADAKKLAAFQNELRMKIRHIDVTLQALAASIQAESKQIVEASHTALLQKRQVIDKEVDGKWRDISEIKELLQSAAKGTDSIPPGFTEDELKDRKADLEAAISDLRQKRDELNTELQRLIDLLKSGQPIPEQGATTLTEERDVLQALKKRAEKLLEG